MPRLLLLLLLLLPHLTHTQPIEISSTPGWGNVDKCIHLCFTGTCSSQSLETRLGCTTKPCLCNPKTILLVNEFMDTCTTVHCAAPRRVLWWKVGAWKDIFQRYCEGQFGPAAVLAEEAEKHGGV